LTRVATYEKLGIVKLFDDIERDDHAPASYRDNEFAFMNRSARPAAEKVRRVLEQYFARYCEDEQATFRDRSRSEFPAAVFELIVHEYLHRVAGDVKCHPDVGSKGRYPDFVATFPDGFQAVVEAVLALDDRRDRLELPASIEAGLLDDLNRAESPSFFLSIVDVENQRQRQLPGNKMRAFLRKGMAQYDPDQVAQDFEDGAALPRIVFEDQEDRVVIDLIPKSPEARGDHSIRPVGKGLTKCRYGGSSKSIRHSIARKAKRYGDLGMPYVVVANCIGEWGYDEGEILEAMFGTEVMTVKPGDPSFNVRRKPDGVWRGPEGPHNTTLSAVLVASVLPWNLPRAEFRLLHNPWAKHPAGHLPWRIPPGGEESLGEILGLDELWPGPMFGSQ